jgi:hypothetical protein
VRFHCTYRSSIVHTFYRDVTMHQKITLFCLLYGFAHWLPCRIYLKLGDLQIDSSGRLYRFRSNWDRSNQVRKVQVSSVLVRLQGRVWLDRIGLGQIRWDHITGHGSEQCDKSGQTLSFSETCNIQVQKCVSEGWKNECQLILLKKSYTAQPGFNELEERHEFTMLNCFFVIWSVVIFYKR